MANGMGPTQISTVMNGILGQVTGKNPMATINTSNFVNVATTALQTGYDPVLNAISQMVGRTIFSNRPYTRKFRTLERTVQEYGNHERKLQALDLDWEDDQQWELTDGESVDMYRVRKPKVLQTNFYGYVVRQRHYTVFRKQLDTAFSSYNEFSQFMAMITQNNSDNIEQSHENLSRYTVANLIGAVILGGTDYQQVHLLTMYNSDRGFTTPKTLVDLKQDRDSWIDFMQYCFTVMENVSDFLEERTYLYHLNLVSGGSTINIPRHTPKRDQRAFFASTMLNEITNTVRTNVFHENFLRMLRHEKVNFWQNIQNPLDLDITPSYTGADGSVKTATDAVKQDQIFGILYDREAAGMTTVDQYVSTTPFNSAGGYWNIFFHYTDKWWNDITENCIVFLMD